MSDAKRNPLDIEPRTKADREFRIAYRSNLGRHLENERLRLASDDYLNDLLQCSSDDRLNERINEVLAGRSGTRKPIWQLLATFFDPK